MSTTQKVGVAVILLLMLVGIGQCGSDTEDSEPADRVETSQPPTPAPEPAVTAPPAAPPPAVPEPPPTPAVKPHLIPAPEPTYPPDDSDDDSGSVYYDNCSDARAAGAAPLHPGEPGYGRHLDRDGDGSACE